MKKSKAAKLITDPAKIEEFLHPLDSKKTYSVEFVNNASCPRNISVIGPDGRVMECCNLDCEQGELFSLCQPGSCWAIQDLENDEPIRAIVQPKKNCRIIIYDEDYEVEELESMADELSEEEEE